MKAEAINAELAEAELERDGAEIDARLAGISVEATEARIARVREQLAELEARLVEERAELAHARYHLDSCNRNVANLEARS